MIRRFRLHNVASFCDDPCEFDNLSKINFIFGYNGTGKTTISRVLSQPAAYSDCDISWSDGTALECFVYNRDFVDRNFDQSSQLDGVFTLGEDNVTVEKQVADLDRRIGLLEDKLRGLEKTLHGTEDGEGKLAERHSLSLQFAARCWDKKKKLDEFFRPVFRGLNNSSERFAARVLDESKNNDAEAVEFSVLRDRAETLYGEDPSKVDLIPPISGQQLKPFASSPILSKRIIGSSDVDIAALIETLNNSDWVQQGVGYYEKSKPRCPFCQQPTEETLSGSLAEYFDDTFSKDIAAVDSLINSYQRASESLRRQIAELEKSESKYLDQARLEPLCSAIASTIDNNALRLKNKRTEPSAVIELDSLDEPLSHIQALIDEANNRISEHNLLVSNLQNEREKLVKQVWRYVLDGELGGTVEAYERSSRGIEKAIANITRLIKERREEIRVRSRERSDLEKKITSVKPTMDAINRLLASFGFTGFSLIEANNGRSYRLVRPDGSDAGLTLSEGEKTFITFLYFFHLIKGSLSGDGSARSRVVVVDDPVSSLDSEVLFIVSTLIKSLIDEIRSDAAKTKQLVLLTHNVYFYKEVTFNSSRPAGGAFSDETFWIVRKINNSSSAERFSENPIRSSYELLWREVRTAGTTSVSIQNTLRRILENYFTILGGVNRDGIIAKFDGKDKVLCQSLFSWVNDGSHAVLDDLYVSPDEATIESYLRIFREVFVKTQHAAHYEMMMQEDGFVQAMTPGANA